MVPGGPCPRVGAGANGSRSPQLKGGSWGHIHLQVTSSKLHLTQSNLCNFRDKGNTIDPIFKQFICQLERRNVSDIKQTIMHKHVLTLSINQAKYD